MTDPTVDTVLVIDFGAQYAQLIARRVREAHVYSEIVAHTTTAAELARRAPTGIILSGGPASVHVEGAPRIDPGIYELGIPILGICYGAQLLAVDLGGEVAKTGRGEYGRTDLVRSDAASPCLFGPDHADHHPVWMSHFDTIMSAPGLGRGHRLHARHAGRRLRGSGPRVVRRAVPPRGGPHGQRPTAARAVPLRGLRLPAPLDHELRSSSRPSPPSRPRWATAEPSAGLSGGVDSAVAAALVHRAIGAQLTCVFVDTGLMREGEGDQVVETFQRHQGIELIHVRAADRFFERLEGVVDPEEKRKAIGELFIRIFEDSAGGLSDARFLVQGTLYPDVIESGTSQAAKIKSHHNVGGLPEDMNFELVEPLRGLFKDEVRELGSELGLPDEIVWRQPFPGPGLGVRIIGEVTPDKVAMLQRADAIVREEIRLAGLERDIWQAFAVLPDIRSVGVMGDERTYGHPVIIRAVTSEDAMTADWARLPYELLERLSSRIINEVAGVNRVAYDITSKPPGTIEWE